MNPQDPCRGKHTTGDGRVGCVVMQPQRGPSTRGRWAAYGSSWDLWLCTRALTAVSLSHLAGSFFRLPQRGHRPLWSIGLQTCWSLLWRGGRSFSLQCSVGFHLVRTLGYWPGFLHDRPEVLIELRIKTFWSQQFPPQTFGYATVGTIQVKGLYISFILLNRFLVFLE